MPPRDVWDCNAIFEPTFYAAYSEFVYRHRAIFGFFPSDLIQESEWDSDDEDDSVASDGEGDSVTSSSTDGSGVWEHESIGSVASSEVETSSAMSLDSGDREAFLDIYQLIGGDGSEGEPFDLTADE